MDGNLYLVVIFFITTVMAQEKFVEEITNFQYSECEQKLERVYCKALNISKVPRQKPSLWPPGPFAIPMSRYGCPESESRGWTKGVLHVKKLGRKNQKKLKRFELNFCVKLRNDTDLDTENWIPGRYSIFMIGEECPAGFKKDTKQESCLEYDSYGPIPNITETGTLKKKILRIGICKKIGNRSTGNKKASNDTYRMLETPFIVLKKKSKSCPMELSSHQGRIYCRNKPAVVSGVLDIFSAVSRIHEIYKVVPKEKYVSKILKVKLVCDHRFVRVVLIVAQSAVCREALKTVYCPPK